MTVLENNMYPTSASVIDNKMFVCIDNYQLFTSIIRSRRIILCLLLPDSCILIYEI